MHVQRASLAAAATASAVLPGDASTVGELDAEPDDKQRRERDAVGDDTAAWGQDVQRKQDGDENEHHQLEAKDVRVLSEK